VPPPKPLILTIRRVFGVWTVIGFGLAMGPFDDEEGALGLANDLAADIRASGGAAVISAPAVAPPDTGPAHRRD
jgi:hypothetical protein